LKLTYQVFFFFFLHQVFLININQKKKKILDNNFGHDGGQAIGLALRENKCLQDIDLSSISFFFSKKIFYIFKKNF